MRQLHLFNTFCVVFGLYLMASFALFSLPLGVREHGLLLPSLNLSHLIAEKSRAAAHLMQERNLALNFIGNIRQLSFQEAAVFQASGLVHLLAISGAQIVPVTAFFSNLWILCVFLILRKFISPIILLKVLEKCGSIFEFFLSFLISSLFGCTGALLRVTGFSFFSKMVFVKRVSSRLMAHFMYALDVSFLKVFILFCVSFAFGNVFQNYSFLLSALGASCAELAHIAVSRWIISKHKIIVHACTALFTCVLVGLFLAPYSSASLVNSCLANVCAIPLVTFLITPLSLGVLVFPEGSVFFTFIIHMLDVSLFILKHIASAFAPKHFQMNPFSQNNPLFTREALIYLNSILLSLWVILDVYKCRGVLKIRMSYIHKVEG